MSITCGFWAERSFETLMRPPSLRKLSVERLLINAIAEGGPLLYHCDSEEQQRSFDSTCRKLRRFLGQAPR